MSLKEPPQPPEIPRRFRLHKHQMIGLPLIALLPILALFRVFGDGVEITNASTPSLRVDIEYPQKFKFKQTKVVRVKVTNLSGSTIDTVNVSLDTAYMSRFKYGSITPEPKRAYVVELTELQPQEKEEVVVEIEGRNYGEQRGTIMVATETDTIRRPITTYIYW
jgi:hypothetical protein